MRKTLFISVIICLVFAAFNVSAAEVKIGYVDLQKAINLCAQGKSAKEQVVKKNAELKIKIDEMTKKFEEAKEKFDQQALMFSEDARDAKKWELQKQLRELQRFAKDSEEELQHFNAQLSDQVKKDIVRVAAELGEKNKFSAIFERYDSSLLYADTSIDLTEQVIKAYDAAQK